MAEGYGDLSRWARLNWYRPTGVRRGNQLAQMATRPDDFETSRPEEKVTAEPAATQQWIRQQFNDPRARPRKLHDLAWLAARDQTGEGVLGMFQGQVPGAPRGEVPGHLLDAVMDNPDWDTEDMKQFLAEHPLSFHHDDSGGQ